jgi:putative FmdB family regulatory protein
MPLRDFFCYDCHKTFEALVRNSDELLEQKCIHCESTKLQLQLSAHSGYSIKGDNSASTRPKGAGSK